MTSGNGAICLQGGRELTPPCDAMDRLVLERCSGTVVVLAGAARPGSDYAGASARTVAHYRRLGVDVEVVPDPRDDHAGALAVLEDSAGLIVLPGGSPGGLLDVLTASSSGHPNDRGTTARAVVDRDGDLGRLRRSDGVVCADGDTRSLGRARGRTRRRARGCDPTLVTRVGTPMVTPGHRAVGATRVRRRPDRRRLDDRGRRWPGVRSHRRRRGERSPAGPQNRSPADNAADVRETLPMTATNINVHPIHLGLGATAEIEPEFTGGMEWYGGYSARHAADGAEGRLVTMHTFTESWDVWEMHPVGAEVVLCTAWRDHPASGTRRRFDRNRDARRRRVRDQPARHVAHRRRRRGGDRVCSSPPAKAPTTALAETYTTCLGRQRIGRQVLRWEVGVDDERNRRIRSVGSSSGKFSAVVMSETAVSGRLAHRWEMQVAQASGSQSADVPGTSCTTASSMLARWTARTTPAARRTSWSSCSTR